MGIVDYDKFCVWTYNAPSKQPRGFWHGDNPADQQRWAYALRSKCGTFWETAGATSGFVNEGLAVKAARARLDEVS